MKTPLDKVKRKINIADYSLKEIAEYFEKFDNYTCIITTSKNIIEFKIHKNILPHLLGLQHVFKTAKDKDEYKGNKGLEKILNEKITLKTIIKQLYSKYYYYKIKDRFEYLPMFFNTLEKNTKLKIINKNKTMRNTLLKGNYALFKQILDKFPMLSLKKIYKNKYVIETFIVESNISLLGFLDNEKIINIDLFPPKVLQPN